MTRNDTIEQCAQLVNRLLNLGENIGIPDAIRALKSTPASDPARSEGAERMARDYAVEFSKGAFGPFGVDTEPYSKIITELLMGFLHDAALASPQAHVTTRESEAQTAIAENREYSRRITALLAKTDWRPDRAHVEGLRNAIDALCERLESATPPSQPVHTAVTETMVEAALKAWQPSWQDENRNERMRAALRAALSAAAPTRKGIKPIQEMTLAEIIAERNAVNKTVDDAANDPDFDGHGGSPFEWHYERLWEIDAALKRAAPASEWRPIETAPKDGTAIDLLLDDSSRAIGMTWVEDRWAFKDLPFGINAFCDEIRVPTHWMPLPAAPAKEGE